MHASHWRPARRVATAGTMAEQSYANYVSAPRTGEWTRTLGLARTPLCARADVAAGGNSGTGTMSTPLAPVWPRSAATTTLRERPTGTTRQVGPNAALLRAGHAYDSMA